MFDSSVAPLFDVNVSSANWNCDNVTIAIAGGENKELKLDNVHTLFSYWFLLNDSTVWAICFAFFPRVR